jgi:hypothetical protein
MPRPAPIDVGARLQCHVLMTNRFASSCLAALLITLASTNAHAEPEAPPPRATEHVWYGWETLLVDAASFSVFLGTVNDVNSPARYVGLAGYALGGPIVHFANEEPGRAAGSLILRVATPTLLAAVAYSLGTRSDSPNTLGTYPAVGAAIVGFSGAVAASLFDATVLARRNVVVDRRPKLSWTPSLSIDPKGRPAAGISGSF